MLRPSFVPPPPIRKLRDLTRYRADLVAARTAEKQRVEKLLQDACIKVSAVVADIFGVSGRDMLAALVAGERDPKVLARRSMRAKIAVLQEAFTGHFTGHRAFLLRTMLGRVDAISADIAALDTRIAEQAAPLAAAVARLDEIPGISLASAYVILAEIGTDMTRFPTAGHLASWARLAAGIKEPAGKNKGKGSTGPRQRLPGLRAGQRRRRRRQDRHVPRREVPADRPPPLRQTRHRRPRPLDPGHRLAPAL
jgi:transposase